MAHSWSTPRQLATAAALVVGACAVRAVLSITRRRRRAQPAGPTAACLDGAAKVPPAVVRATGGPEDAEAIALAVRAHGVCCVPEFFDPVRVRAWAAELARMRREGEVTSSRNRNLGRSELNFDPSAHPFSPGAGGVLADERLVSALRKLLGPKARVETAGLVAAEPGAAEQRWHQDVPHLFAHPAHLPPHFIAVFVPLCAVSHAAGNGPTEFQPSSHVKANAARALPAHAFDCPLGSLIVFDGRVLHRGAANRSAAPREVLFLNVCRHWYRDMYNKLENRLAPLL